MTIDEFLTLKPSWRPVADLLVLPPTADEIRDVYPDADRDLLARCDELILEAGFPLTRGTLYWRIRIRQEGDKLAAMLALQQPPRCETTDTFWGGRKHFSEVYGTEYADHVKRELAKRGVNLLPGQEYMPELAQYTGDPQAVIPFNGARDYIKGVLKSRGWAGAVGGQEVQAREPESDPWDKRVPLAPDLVNESIRDLVAEDPKLKKKQRAELREAVLAKHGPSH